MSNLTLEQLKEVFDSLGKGEPPLVMVDEARMFRTREDEFIVQDLQRLKEGGNALRLVVAPYGCGKTFFLKTARQAALQLKFVTAFVQSSRGNRPVNREKERAFISELACSFSTLQADNNLPRVVEQMSRKIRKAAQGDLAIAREEALNRLLPLNDLPRGNDFRHVLTHAMFADTDTLRSYALQWLKAEFATKGDAKRLLGVSSIVEGDPWQYLKLWAKAFKLMEGRGLVVFVDEFSAKDAGLTKDQRQLLYDQLLKWMNASHNGGVESLGVYFSIPEDVYEDRTRGPLSNEALATRLAEIEAGLEPNSLNHPVVRLQPFSGDEFFNYARALLRLRLGESVVLRVPDEDLRIYLATKAKVPTFATRVPDLRLAVKHVVGLCDALEEQGDKTVHDFL